jgi:hypothetical protein
MGGGGKVGSWRGRSEGAELEGEKKRDGGSVADPDPKPDPDPQVFGSFPDL